MPEAERQRARPRDSEGAGPEPFIASALRRCRQPVPARVAVEADRPVRVTTDRRGFVGGTVVQCAGPWRTSGEWWRAGGHASPQAREERPARSKNWNRDEWDVSLSDGAVYRVFRDRDTDGWFIDAVVD
jgi:protein ImuB